MTRKVVLEAPKPKTAKQFVVKAIRNMVAKELEAARERVLQFKFVPTHERETHQDGRVRTEKLALAQASFDAINRIHRKLNKVK